MRGERGSLFSVTMITLKTFTWRGKFSFWELLQCCVLFPLQRDLKFSGQRGNLGRHTCPCLENGNLQESWEFNWGHTGKDFSAPGQSLRSIKWQSAYLYPQASGVRAEITATQAFQNICIAGCINKIQGNQNWITCKRNYTNRKNTHSSFPLPNLHFLSYKAPISFTGLYYRQNYIQNSF